MKSRFLILFLLPIAISNSQTADRTDLLCRKWVLVGSKPFNMPYRAVNPQMAKIMQFNKDGTYQEEMFSLKSKGVWEFNTDSTMFNISLTEFNGSPTKGLSLKDSKPTDRILKLTRDSLIYGMEAYYGPERTFGHDDWYFVPVK